MRSPCVRPGRGRLRARGAVAGLLLLSVAGCAAGAPAPAPVPGTQALVRSELYFGRLKPDGSIVTDAEWRSFVADQIAPRFPDGFTVLDAMGQYRRRDGQIIAEPTKILQIVHAPDARPRASVQELRDRYRELFQQESVLLIENPARAGF